MPKLIALDDGHGKNTAGKRTPHIPKLGRAIRENEFNKEVVRYLDIELRRCGFKTLLTAPTDEDTPLQTRVTRANNAKADLFISIHFNAFDGTFAGRNPEGFSAHIDPTRGKSEVFAKQALKRLAGGTKQVNRGVVLQNLYVTRNTRMPAVLFELGFMDNPREANLMLNKAFQRECARELAMAVCDFYKVRYVPEKKPVSKPAPKPSDVMFRVVVGSFKLKLNAQRQLKKVEAHGFKGFLAYHNGHYRVVIGSFGERKNAEFRQRQLKSKGFDSFLMIEG